ncbi:hypothetical protein JCM33374_g3482 [Metschnikowia sp. JCM 33374]|nr:hypothetical protein JCM33374_g3482 [Metschnikowia sp. JCM 33374]
MTHAIHDTYVGENTVFNQYKYSSSLYNTEISYHAAAADEYASEISEAMNEALQSARPNIKLLAHQPYLGPNARYKLVDFALKLSVRLKLLPFVFCHSVSLFDRYCSKRIVLLEQGQLVMATCVWVAAKVHGGNCHFANLSNESSNEWVESIMDVGYGCGARFEGPTQRYRTPRIKELIKLCGARCNYTPRMFTQMEMYIMQSLDWNITAPGIDDFMVSSEQLKVPALRATSTAFSHEFFRMKQFLAYAACFSYDLIQFDNKQLAQVSLDLINQSFKLSEKDPRFQAANSCMNVNDFTPDLPSYATLRKHLVASVAKAPAYLLEQFCDKGPFQLFTILTCNNYSFSFGMSKPSASSPQAYSPPSRVVSPISLPYYDSPVTPRHFTYESVTQVAKSAKRVMEGSGAHPDREDFYPRSCRRNNTGLNTPPIYSAHMHSHQYPHIVPQTAANCPQTKDSQSSARSSDSAKEHEIFDNDRPKMGVITPATTESICKDRNSCLPDMPIHNRKSSLPDAPFHAYRKL